MRVEMQIYDFLHNSFYNQYMLFARLSSVQMYKEWRHITYMCEDERDYENGLPNILLQFVELTGNSWICNMQSHMIFSQLELLKW